MQEDEKVDDNQQEVEMINTQAKDILGAQNLNLDADHPLNQSIQIDNHRYWHIRLLFRPEFREFVVNILLFWNTANVIPATVSWRNDDNDLLNNWSENPKPE